MNTFPVAVKSACGKTWISPVASVSRQQAEAIVAKSGNVVLEGVNVGWVMMTPGNQVQSGDVLNFFCPVTGMNLVVDTITIAAYGPKLFGSRAPSRFLLTFHDSAAKMLISADKQYKIVSR